MTTIRAVLFGDILPERVASAAAGAEDIARRLAAVGALPAGPVAGSAARAVLDRTAEVLDIEISEVLVGVWRTGSALLEAARATRARPGSTQRVTLRTFAFSWAHESDVDVDLQRATVARLAVVAHAEIEITGLAATVHDGRITAVTGGDGDIAAAVSLRVLEPAPAAAEVALAHGSRTFELRYEVNLTGSGLSLL